MNESGHPPDRESDGNWGSVPDHSRLNRRWSTRWKGGLILALWGMGAWSTQAQSGGTNRLLRPAPVSAAGEVSTAPALDRRTGKEAESIAQGRLVPTSQEKLIERHGFFGSLFARSGRVNPLQLVNPAAPREYGGIGTPSPGWSWNPMLAPGQAPLPRGFQDPNTHEASAVVIRGSFR